MEEQWADLPECDVRISSTGRVQRISTGKIVEPIPLTKGRRGAQYRIRDPKSSKGAVRSFKWIAKRIASLNTAKPSEWSPEEDAVLRSNSATDAARILRNRSLSAIYQRRSTQGWSVRSMGTERPCIQTMSIEEFQKAAEASVAKWVRGRDDVLSAMLILRLEGFKGSVRMAARKARRDDQRQTFDGKSVSIDAPLGHTRKTMHDLLSA